VMSCPTWTPIRIARLDRVHERNERYTRHWTDSLVPLAMSLPWPARLSLYVFNPDGGLVCFATLFAMQRDRYVSSSSVTDCRSSSILKVGFWHGVRVSHPPPRQRTQNGQYMNALHLESKLAVDHRQLTQTYVHLLPPTGQHVPPRRQGPLPEALRRLR
jgi:hypothetical protein